MARTALIAYLSIPALLAAGTFASALRYEPFGPQMLLAYVVGGFLFYAAPHLLWGIVAALCKFSGAVKHAGFIAACLALAAIAVMSFVVHDPSGLPIQWLLYWPLALVLQVGMAGASALYLHRRRSVGA